MAQRARVIDARRCAATQSRWLESRWAHLTVSEATAGEKMKVVTINVKKAKKTPRQSKVSQLLVETDRTVQTCRLSFPVGDFDVVHLNERNTNPLSHQRVTGTVAPVSLMNPSWDLKADSSGPVWPDDPSCPLLTNVRHLKDNLPANQQHNQSC